MPIYMKIPDINGDSTVKGFEKQFELLSLSYGVVTPYSASNNVGGRPSFTPITVTLPEFNAPSLLRAVATGQHLGTVTITFLNQTQGVMKTYEQILLDEMVITQIQTTTTGDRPLVELALAYSKIQVKQTDPAVTFAYDLRSGKAL